MFCGCASATYEVDADLKLTHLRLQKSNGGIAVQMSCERRRARCVYCSSPGHDVTVAFHLKTSESKTIPLIRLPSPASLPSPSFLFYFFLLYILLFRRLIHSGFHFCFNTTFPLVRFKPRGSLRFYRYFCRRKTAVVLQKVGQLYVLTAVNAVPSRSSRYMCGFVRFFAVVEPLRNRREPRRERSKW